MFVGFRFAEILDLGCVYSYDGVFELFLVFGLVFCIALVLFGTSCVCCFVC